MIPSERASIERLPERPFPELSGQRGLATTTQLREAGWTTSAVRHARRTRWQEPMPRVIAPHRGKLDQETRLVAIGLWAGPKSILTGGAALHRLGLQFDRHPGAILVIPDGARARSHLRVRLVRSARLPEVATRLGPVSVARGARALVDAAVFEEYRSVDLEHLTISTLQRGVAAPEELERELWIRPRARVGGVWKGLEAFLGGAWSRPEVVLRQIIESSGDLPPLTTNCRLVTDDGELAGIPDGYFADVGVAVQVHSRRYHQGVDDAGGDQWARTVEKDSVLVAAGVRVVGVSPWTLYVRPERFLSRLRRAVAVGVAGPKPNVRVAP